MMVPDDLRKRSPDLKKEVGSEKDWFYSGWSNFTFLEGENRTLCPSSVKRLWLQWVSETPRVYARSNFRRRKKSNNRRCLTVSVQGIFVSDRMSRR